MRYTNPHLLYFSLMGLRLEETMGGLKMQDLKMEDQKRSMT